VSNPSPSPVAPVAEPDPAPTSVSFAEALRFWLKLGFISFGGPAGQIAIMHTELVERRRWISEQRFLHALNYCMVLPGPEAQQLATYIGWLKHRTWGGMGLWMLAMAALVAVHGVQDTLTQMGWFFTKAALLTCGGAYAVLPYVYQGAVETHQWLSDPQMIDGLALGETTPGPLIMVVAFVGFVGGWLKQVLGPDALFLGGALAATIVTFFTFLPSFIFILAGGPLVESTHGKLGFTAPLSAITAAVVGVILNLALFFAYHVFWPQGFEGRFDVLWAAIGLGAAIALFRFKLGVLPLLGACAAIGLLSSGLSPLGH
jgi:chromate transport protein ChrA